MILTNSSTIGICGKLWNKEEELKNYSIFLQETDEKTDFDFFVFIDQGKDKYPPFLRELFHCIEKREGFAIPEHKEQLKEWLGNENNDLLIPLNWLKIAIERYPYRLFVVTDRISNQSQDQEIDLYKNEFIRKRICFIKKDDFSNLFKNGDPVFIRFNNTKMECSSRYVFLKLWLFKKWLEHLNEKVTGNKIDSITIEFDFRNGGDVGFIPITLPPSLIERKSQSENNTQRVTIEFKSNTENQNSRSLEIKFKRHSLPYYRNRNQLQDYREALSGSQSVFPLFLRMDSYEEKLKIFLSFLIAEVGLLLWAIIDERVLRWWVEYCKEKTAMLGLKVLPIGALIKNKDTKWEYENELKKSYKYKFVIDNNNIFIEKPRNSGKLLPHLLIIHEGIREKAKLSVEDILKIKEIIPFVIITSGRGKPFTLPRGVKFLPFSIVESVLMKDYPEKFIINKIIMSGVE